MTKYHVHWKLNGKSYSQSFDFLTIAYFFMYKLEDEGYMPSLHVSDGNVTEMNFVMSRLVQN